ncbi:DegV family protein [Clostridium tetani]|uniref:DegV protein n=2 Tax=Clostridium tetani TaxID=1513 RepID=Q892T7_CLOTE|nr:DegV family protein [Clostridium tetani]AAO36507.1 degV protein [Clostridium tetani E88]AVP54990.1 DegV family protein [Clostridium tetani]KGI38990.1 DegV domain-containing protein [Clostridium tetani]KGI39444.1 DegV domain-containing protein [Clostridium tetani ATCC 9441]KGI43559.1 DegV domain-containing protein [Clostridium tetani]
MRDFEIFTDSCSDLPIEYIKEKNIKFARLTCTYNDKTYFDDFGQNLSYKEFFDDLRKGVTPITSQPSVDEFYTNFKSIVNSGKDILYICVSTGLSGSENSATIAKNMMLEDYPNAKIYIVNVLTASLGQGIMVMKAVEMKEEGKSLEDIVSYVEEHKQRLNTFMTVDDLNHLKRGGRLSTAAAMIGTVFNIKPILSIDQDGRVISIDKTRGRKGSLKKLADLLLERIEEAEKQIIGISHGDCIEEVLKLKDAILSKINVKDVIINYTGPAVGTHGGPNSVSIFFMGKERKIL